MNARLIKAWNDLQSSYYFIPGLMAIGSIILAYITGHLDKYYNYEIAEKIGWFYSNKADGARAILTTIAGSMMTVASVTFSITMVAVTSAAGQYGPRLIGNFMRDRGNQITLGTFTSTFVYCLLILRSARTGDGGSGDNAVAEFVPNISLLVAMGLTLASVAVMIYFIHHIPETLNVGNITGRLGRAFRRDLERAFPKTLETNKVSEAEISRITALNLAKADPIASHAEGYIQAINQAALAEFADENNYIINLTAKPGDFVTKDETLAHVWPVNDDDELTREAHSKIRAAFAMGQERTAYQNTLFLSDQLVEILARALSPGVNDPFTAINCLHWLKSGLQTSMKGETKSPYILGKSQAIRLIVPTLDFEKVIDSICYKIRPYVAKDVNVSREMAEMLFTLLQTARTEAHKSIITAHIEGFEKAVSEGLHSAIDREYLGHYIEAQR